MTNNKKWDANTNKMLQNNQSPLGFLHRCAAEVHDDHGDSWKLWDIGLDKRCTLPGSYVPSTSKGGGWKKSILLMMFFGELFQLPLAHKRDRTLFFCELFWRPFDQYWKSYKREDWLISAGCFWSNIPREILPTLGISFVWWCLGTSGVKP